MSEHNYCVVLVCNESFLNHALFLANNLLKLKNIAYDVVICSGDEISSQVPANIKFIQIETEEFTNNLPTIPRLQKYSYWRIPAIDAVSNSYSKILYLDVDIYINCEDISELFNLDLDGKMIGAVRDVQQITRPNRMPLEFKALNLKFTNYFNAGLLLIDCKKWREQDAFQNIVFLSKKYTNILYCHDQSLLNLLVKGNWVELSPVWNWQYSYRNCFITEVISPKLIHFCGAEKFWNILDVMIPTRYRESYHLYLHQSLPKDFPSGTINFEYFKVFLKNMWYFNKHNIYISKFKNSYMTISHFTK